MAVELSDILPESNPGITSTIQQEVHSGIPPKILLGVSLGILTGIFAVIYSKTSKRILLRIHAVILSEKHPGEERVFFLESYW